MSARPLRNPLLFDELPRSRSRRVLMEVEDAGNGCDGTVIAFRCRKCGHETGWVYEIPEDRRLKGRPCPKCNEGEEA